jgi:Tol biopolymer transport system component
MANVIPQLATALEGRYTIERELGAGGMATVYLAQDLRHDRKVALKVLRPELAAVIGAERFLAEIKTTANLQHPHILALFDSGEAGGFVFYVMPYVEGESLRDRLNREKQLPVEEAVRIAKEVADALEYAHSHDVVHRDIKPENILLHGGHALVADFGIALAASRSEGGSRLTETGMSLGTPHYMSPEQAMGQREITARSDVYALGCVLYEMLTGEPPFNGPTPQAIVARVMTEEPRSLTLQRKSIPPHVEAAVNLALEKLPADRFASAAAFGAALQNTGFTTGAAAPAGGARLRRGRPGVAVVALAVVALAASVAAGALYFRRPLGTPPAKFAMTLPGEVPPVAVRLSPDGTTIAYAAAGSDDRVAIYIRRLDDLTVRKLEGTEDAATISFSPDGRWVAFVTAGGQPRKVSVGGGGALPIPVRGGGTITQVQFAGSDRFIVTLGDGSLAMVEPDGSTRVVAAPDSSHRGRVLAGDQVLPDGSVLGRYWDPPPNGPVVLLDPANGRVVTLVDQPASWSGAGDGFLAWTLTDGTMFAAPFDLKARKLTGPPVALAGASVYSVLGFVPPAAAAASAIVYVPNRQRMLARVDRDGRSIPLIATDRSYHSPRVSPDGRRIALDFTDQQRDVWLFTLRDSTLTRFGFDSSAHDPTWLPDGKGLLFAGVRGPGIGIFRRRFDGGSAAEQIYLASAQTSAHTVTPDGKTAVAVDISTGQFDLFAIPLDGRKEVDTLAASGYNEGYPAISPDGRWLAYVSDESGRAEVYVRSFPAFGGKVQVSQDGGSEPVWARSGRELFYRSGGGRESFYRTGAGSGPMLISAELETAGEFRVTGRIPLFPVSGYEFATPHANYDVFPDGKSFVMVRQGRPGQSAELVYLQNVAGLIKSRTE